ncbi:lipopolysaccharide core biosynthesis protein RfaZ [Salmonella bongori]|nr:lipopolysaccharide core biosynthesis protein RfaZ [Salmonella bongori]
MALSTICSAINVKPFLYLLTDVRFLHNRREDFYKFSSHSQFTIVNLDVYEQATAEDKKYIEENCLIIRSFYRREKGGFLKKIKFNFLRRIHKSLLISVPFSKRGRLTGFCKDISIGYCSLSYYCVYSYSGCVFPKIQTYYMFRA